MNHKHVIFELKKNSSKKTALQSLKFFKGGKDEYGRGMRLLGLSIPQVRTIAKKNLELKDKELKFLISNKVHEIRLCGLMILVEKYKKIKNPENKKQVVDFYLKQKQFVNNWDLVDLTSYKILGDYLFHFSDAKLLYSLAKSKRHWDRRIAMVSTYAFIKHKETNIVFDLAKILLQDHEDLMHKAVGWMLREAGKRSPDKLKTFINQNGKKMPRTMLRYSIEKFPESERKKILLETKIK